MDLPFEPEFAETPLEVRVTSFAPEPSYLAPNNFADLPPEPVAATALYEPGVIAEGDDVAQMLAPFFHKGFLGRREAKGLMDPNKRQEAERRLRTRKRTRSLR